MPRRRNNGGIAAPNAPSRNKFPKGKSGNPGGMPKAQVAMRRLAHELVADATDQGRTIITFAANVLDGRDKDCDDSKSRRWAADFLADRLWGRAPVKVEIGGPEDSLQPEDRAMLDALRLSPHERRDRIAELRRKVLALAPPAEAPIPIKDPDDGADPA